MSKEDKCVKMIMELLQASDVSTEGILKIISSLNWDAVHALILSAIAEHEDKYHEVIR